MSKIAIVGVEGSGKTVLMAGLSECYKQISEEEPYLMPENQSAFMFMQRIPHKLRVDREWPEQTRIDSMRMMKWTLRYGQEILEEIEILDYPGEIYRIAFGEHTKEEADAVRSELNEFLEHLTEADTLVVLLNLADLVDLHDNPRNAETVWITRGIFDFAKKLPNLKHRMLAFTQADRYADEIEKAGSAKELYAAKLPMMKTLYPDLKVFTVSAVDGIDADGRPKDGYSVAGCYEFLREVLVEENRAIISVHNECDSLYKKLKGFNQGSPVHFKKLVESYAGAVDDFESKIKPLYQLYEKIVEKHSVTSATYTELQQLISNSVQKHKIDGLAQKSGWDEILDQYNGCEGIVSAFCEYYVEEYKRKKGDDRESKILMIVTIAFCSLIAFAISFFAWIENQSVKKEKHKNALINSDFEKKIADSQLWTSPETGMKFIWIDSLKMAVGKYEVTNAEYQKKEPSHDSKEFGGHGLNRDRQPVVYVDSSDAVSYAKWLTEKDRAVGALPSTFSYRIPTDQEWLGFARCGDDRKYPWGNSWPPHCFAGNYDDETMFNLNKVSDKFKDGSEVTCNVDDSYANIWGLYGVGGNVWEFTLADRNGFSSFLRGASWVNSEEERLRCSFRVRDDKPSCYSGFRLVLSCDIGN